MRKQIASLCFFLLITNVLLSQTTAVDFNTVDCAGTVHHLYSDLDSGKVVILDFVMPCGFCIAPSLSAYKVFEEFKLNYPNRILFYLSDGFGSNLCSDLNTWAAANTISDAFIFSSHAVTMNDYGAIGMPKVVIFGGANHQVYYNQNDSLAGDSLALYSAIDSALKSTATIQKRLTDNFQLKLFPNPVVNKGTVSYTLAENTDLILEIFNTNSEKIYDIKRANELKGKHETEIGFEKFAGGNYLLVIRTNKSSSSIQFTITR
ncbi:MAG: hypothetical protein A3F72_17300 [Bacteroidetes bacterium RIFCSPLOWO2_12_FULL_35_15]|nr:MAG: hypothetical protein A3F72_17300 [Bacteroidetes bacterium RIFCSPLOWO2_12_FULL_35_15]